MACLDAFAGWLFQVARNRAYKTLRKRGLVTQPIDDADVADVEDSALDDAEQKRLLESSLTQLSHEQREVLHLRYVEQLSYEQIAVALDIPVGTVRSRLNRARGRLREPAVPSGREPVDHTHRRDREGSRR